jgi:hypothetical protein
MKMKNYFQMLAVAAGMVVATAPFNSCKKSDSNDDADEEKKDEEIVDVASTLPDSIRNGSDFYIIFLDEASADLGDKVKEPIMLRDYDVWQTGETLEAGESVGVNAWGAPAEYIPWIVTGTEGWNGGGIVGVRGEGEPPLELSPIMEGGFYFHLATKSPSNQPNAGVTLIFPSDGTEVKYYFGKKENQPTDVPNYGGDYPHDGEWYHFEIPVSELEKKGYSWTGPFRSEKRYLISYMSIPHALGTELNLDALFFYKKPAK